MLEKNGVDPYVFYRFLIMMTKALIPIWFLSWSILLPINAVNTGVDGKSGLDQLTAGNIDGSDQKRFWAHLILDYIFICKLSNPLRVISEVIEEADHPSLDSISHLERDARLASRSTKILDQSRTLQITTSEYCTGSRYTSTILGRVQVDATLRSSSWRCKEDMAESVSYPCNRQVHS